MKTGIKTYDEVVGEMLGERVLAVTSFVNKSNDIISVLHHVDNSDAIRSSALSGYVFASAVSGDIDPVLCFQANFIDPQLMFEVVELVYQSNQ